MANDPFQFIFDHVNYNDADETNLTLDQAREMSDEQLVLHPVARVALRRGWYLANSSRTSDGRPIRRGDHRRNVVFDRAVARLMRLMSEAPEPRERWIEMIENSMQRIIANISMRPPWTERSPLSERQSWTDRSSHIKRTARVQRPPRVQRPVRPCSPSELPPNELNSLPTPENKS